MRLSATVLWSDISELGDAYRLLSLFRSTNPMLGGLQPETLHWEVSWSEGFVLLDMSDTCEVRAYRRVATVFDVSLSCATGPDDVGITLRVADPVPQVVLLFILAYERERGG